MADNKNLSVPEILALCRQTDGGGGSDVGASPAETTAETTAASESAPAAAKKAAAQVDPGKMSVADMLAAARAEKDGPATAGTEASPAAAEQAPPSSTAAKVDPKKMSVADMLAAARGEKTGGTAAAPKAAKPSAAKQPAAKAKPTPKAAQAAPARSGPMDTSSILAAARSAAKPGPMTKAEAAAKAKAKADGTKPAKPKAPPMPAKPEYAKPVVASPQKATDRRSMMEILFGSALAIGFGAMTITAGLSSLVMARFFFPNLLVEPPSQFKVGFPGDFSGGTVATKFKAQFGIWVVNAEYEGQQQIFALKSVCTHLGCTPNWLEAEQKFKCPCHGSGFYKEGINFEGPAPRPLERYAIRVADDGQIAIDKSKTFQEQLGQWRDSASFVPV